MCIIDSHTKLNNWYLKKIVICKQKSLFFWFIGIKKVLQRHRLSGNCHIPGAQFQGELTECKELCPSKGLR